MKEGVECRRGENEGAVCAGISGKQRAAAENGVRGAIDDFAVRDDVGVQWLVISVVKRSNCVFRS